jgi:hypothetical protein
MPRPSAAAARLVAPGVAAVQAGHKVRHFTVADDLIRVLTDVSTCRWLPLKECPYAQFTGQEPERGYQMAISLPLRQKESRSKAVRSWPRPTNKWWAALVTVAGSWVVNLITAGAFTKTIAIALVGIVSQMTVAYLVPNDNTPGGVPIRKDTEG